MVGEEEIRKRVENGVLEKKFCEGYVFWGGRGRGKRSGGKIFGKGVKCEDGGVDERWKECAGCKGIRKG